MRRPRWRCGSLGTLESGKYADMVIVDGDPTLDVRVLQDDSRITAVMKDGQLYRGLTPQDEPKPRLRR